MRTREDRGALVRSRWAAIGAAVAVAVGAGGVVQWASASSGAPSGFVGITPLRVLDTRGGVDVGLAGPFVSPVSQDLMITGNIPTTTGSQVVVPPRATGVVLNVTVVQPTNAGFVSVRPADAPGAPATSSLNFEAGVTQPNAVTVQLPTSGADAGAIEITYDAYGTPGATTDLLVDVVGYYVPAAATPPVTDVLTIPYTQFLPGASTGGYAYGTVGGHVGRSMSGPGSGANRLSTALMLPHGATVTSITAGARDNGPADLNLSLVRYDMATQTGSLAASGASTGAANEFRTFPLTIDPAAAVMDNAQYLYTLEIFLSNWNVTTYEIGWVTVTYTMP